MRTACVVASAVAASFSKTQRLLLIGTSVMEECDVSRVVVGCFSDASLRDTDSDQHIDMVQCIWHELMDIADIQSADLDAMVYSVEEMLDQLPVGYYAGGRRELLDVFIELMTMFTSWSV
jgi:hypothetical protein